MEPFPVAKNNCMWRIARFEMKVWNAQNVWNVVVISRDGFPGKNLVLSEWPFQKVKLLTGYHDGSLQYQILPGTVVDSAIRVDRYT